MIEGPAFELPVKAPKLVKAPEKIREIIESGTQKLRHPVGPDAEGFLGWRASLTDEEWVEWGALSDDAWYERVAKDFGLDAASKRGAATGASAVGVTAGA